MSWSLEEALSYYRSQGAPQNQTSLIQLLQEIQDEHQGSIPLWVLPQIAEAYNVKETFVRAIIRRIPRLRLSGTHCLELCGGPNCSRAAALASFAERTYGSSAAGVTIRQVGCMRLCGKGPNLKWDGILYHHADEALIRSLMEQAAKES